MNRVDEFAYVDVKTAQTVWPRLDFLKLMALSREGDRREGILMRQGKGWFHVGAMGHEAIGALAYLLETEDYLFPYYRDKSLVLARGIEHSEIALAFFAQADSSSGGRMMPGHFSSRALNIFSVATPTGSQCLPAAGAAWACKREDAGRVVLCSVGDAASREGEFYEALCFALQERLPIVFVVEDNGYGISTSTRGRTPYSLLALGESCGERVNGRDPQLVYEAGAKAIAAARRGEGPSLLWCEVDRLCSHTSSDDQRIYREQCELEAMAKRDPISLFAQQLIGEEMLSPEEWTSIQTEIIRRVDHDYKLAEAAESPNKAEILGPMYGVDTKSPKPPISPGQPMTMVAAVNQTLRAALDSDDKVVLFGEDIEDPKGGVFGLTKGLSADFPGRVANSPLAEATIVGLGVGMATVGYRPVFELQFIDFVGPAMHQLMTQVACLRWRTLGEWTCPLVMIAPYGAYLPAGALWHSQSNDGMFAHIPGIRIAIPSTPEDAAGLLWSAIQGEDPTLVLLPKHLFRKRTSIPDPVEPVPFGKAVVRREGSDVSVISWGNCVEIAMEAAEQADSDGVSAEVIDLRTLVPCDWETIESSLKKTGRLVVVHEDTRTTGFGQAIIAEMTSHSDRWNLFLSPPQLVARPDVPIPFNPELEAAVLPDVSRVLDAIHAAVQ